uniref:Theileria-specific sub-telomeric protein, putative n=1 Tax=Theileria annulata TaxID=5874 RepID=A0A3B0N7C3_THEAN
MSHICSANQADFGVDQCELLISAYALAGLAMMLNIRLSYSSAPYALIRFQLPENLFSVFVRRMASALELWCLPSMLLGNIIDLIQKAVYSYGIDEALRLAAGTEENAGGKLRGLADALYQKANALDTAVVGEGAPGKQEAKELATEVGVQEGTTGKLRNALQKLYDDGTDPANLPTLAKAVKDKYGEVKGKFNAVKGQKQSGQYASQGSQYKDVVDAWNAFNNLYHDVISSTKYNSIVIPSIISQWLNFLTYVVLLFVYVMGGDHGHLTAFYGTIAVSGFVFGINMTLVYAADFNYLVYYIAGENSFPVITSFIHYITTLIFGNRRKYNSDYIVVGIDIIVAIIISFVAAVVWTHAYTCKPKDSTAPDKNADNYHHIYASGFDTRTAKPGVVSPCLMVIVGMGLVYAIYPGIAPGMIVPFYLIDKIEMVLLIMTTFPPIIIAILRKTKPGGGSIATPMAIWGADEQSYGSYVNSGKPASGQDGYFWHAFDLLMVIKISLAVVFICCLHYRESHISRSIINQPKMSTFLTIVFYMCHECLLAIGFPGIFGGNAGGEYIMLPTQYIGALFMIFLAFYSEGYIIEYKSHDPAHWPTGVWYLYGYYQLNPNFFVMIKFNVCSDGYCDFK